MGDFVYEYVGGAPQEFVSLSGELVFAQGRADAVLQPGEQIELDEPVHALGRLEPVSDAAKAAALEYLAAITPAEPATVEEPATPTEPPATGDAVSITPDQPDAPTDASADPNPEA